ncbi:MAG: DUF1501 domain-containing protein [Planctomycetia bacterium]|nr:DUF1501 domain-containing protein [Planctomycetia bacterium]
MPFPATLSRRALLARAGCGFGSLALHALLAQESLAEQARGNPLAPRPGHAAPRARAVIWLFMHGGPSAIDLYDPKPTLQKRSGEALNLGTNVGFFASSGKLMPSPFAFRRHGQCRAWVSDVLPGIARHVDDLAFIRSVHVESNNHGPALYEMNTGFARMGFPSTGAWVTYGLGSENQNLPGFVVMTDYRGALEGGPSSWGAGFLPGAYQGTAVSTRGTSPILHLRPPAAVGQDRQRAQLDLVRRLNQQHQELRPGEADLEARLASYELAYRMQLEAPEALDLTKETAATQRLYGIDQKPSEYYGKQLLTARRLIERGVRFVQVFSGGYDDTVRWDAHADVKKNHGDRAAEIDMPVAGLLTDLKQRGLLDSTLVIWGGEFGRLPISQGDRGRDHNRYGFTIWMAGGGIKGGASHGSTDELGWKAAEDPVTVNDIHATILHQLGLDHTKLTYLHQGRRFRLTDVAGEVIQDILANERAGG